MIEIEKLDLKGKITYNKIATKKVCLYCPDSLEVNNWTIASQNTSYNSTNYYKCDSCYKNLHPTNPKSKEINQEEEKVLIKICNICSVELNEDNWLKSLQGSKNTSGHDSKICSNCYLERQRNKRFTRRRKLLERYGNKCNCCGYGNLDALDIDHVFNDGYIERRTVNDMVIHVTNLGYPKDRYQLLCRNCNKMKLYNKGVCNCQDSKSDTLQIRTYTRKSKNINIKFGPLEEKKCTDCSVLLDDINFQKHACTKKGHLKYVCKSCSLERQSNYRLQRRKLVLEEYGNKCVQCSYSKPMALEIDHIYNDGNIERKDKKIKCFYRHVIQQNFPKDKYQILCCNCNYLKHHNPNN
jgi:hypothetical protein